MPRSLPATLAIPALLLLTSAAPRDFAAERARLSALNAQEAALAARIGANRTSLERLLGALEMWRRDPPPALLVSPQRARDAARAAILMRAMAPEMERRAQALSAQAQALARVRRQAAEAGAALFAAESRGADRAVVLAGRVAPDRGGDPLLSADERAAVDAARGDRLALGAQVATSAPPPARLRAPVLGAPVLRFGETPPGRPRSEGVAWASPPGAPVLAPADGEVEYAGPLHAWKLVVILRLAGGWRVVLAGLQSVAAPVGAQVRAGDVIGRAPPAPAPAAVGRPPSEVYLELRRGATPVDPGPVLAKG